MCVTKPSRDAQFRASPGKAQEWKWTVMKRERVAHQARKVERTEVVEEIVVDETETVLLNDIDELLDEIDAVLEDQSVLIGFRQRSGQ